MPTIFGHALVGAAIVNFARPLLPDGLRWRAAVAGGLVAMLPDADALGFRLGVEYGSHFGHRGFTHSLVFASATAAALALRLALAAPALRAAKSSAAPRTAVHDIALAADAPRAAPPDGARGGASQIKENLSLYLLLFLLLFAAAASHPLLDMLTDGGYGVALLAPWSWARLFFSVTPIPVSPIGVGPGLAYVLSWEAAFFIPLFLGSIAAHWGRLPWLRVGGAAVGILATAGAFLVRLGF